ncbi:MAG: fimbrillin family protein, partial [Rikenellaceae bacterium]
MRKISIKAIAACTMALAMASCQVNDEQLGQDANYTQDDFAPITFSSNITTRATEANFEVGDMISVAAYYSDNSIYRQNVEYTYTNDALFESSSPIKYEDNIQYLSFTAVYPYTEVSEDGDLSFEVKSDQSEDTNYTLSDLMNSSASPTQSTTPSLTFDHLLANIVVNIYSEDVLLDGAVATLKAKRGVNCNILSGTTEATGDVETIKMASNGTNSYKAIIAPQTFNDGIFICVEVDSMKYYITYEGGKTFEPALQYTYNLEIYDGTLRFTTVINSWKEGNIDEDGTYEESGEGESEQVQPEEDDEEDVEEATKEIDDDSVTLLDRSTWTLTASATEEYEGALEYAIDGEFGTYWHSP